MNIKIICIFVFTFSFCGAMEKNIEAIHVKTGDEFNGTVSKCQIAVSKMVYLEASIDLLINETVYEFLYNKKSNTLTQTEGKISANYITGGAPTSLGIAKGSYLTILPNLQAGGFRPAIGKHQTKIIRLYNCRGSFFISASRYPSFKIWSFTTESEKNPFDSHFSNLELIDEMRNRILLGVGWDHTVLYATPKSWLKRWPFASDEYVIKYAKFDLRGLQAGIEIKAFTSLHLKKDTIKNYDFYYNGAQNDLYYVQKGKQVSDIYSISIQDQKNAPMLASQLVTNDLIKILFINEDPLYLTQKMAIIKDKEIKLTQTEEEIVLDGVIVDTLLFYATKRRSNVFVCIKDLTESLEKEQSQTSPKELLQTEITMQKLPIN